MLNDLNARLVRVLLVFAAALIFALSFLVVADVFGRSVLNAPVKGAPELGSMSIVIICFLLAPYAVQSHGMISADIFVSAFGVRGRAFGLLLSSVLGLMFFGLIMWGSYEPTLHAWTTGEYEGEGALRVPVWPARIVILIGAALVVVSYVLHAASALATLVSGRAEGDVPSASTHL